MDLQGKVVLVTGGTRGIGRGIADGFLEAGATVVVCARNEPEALSGVDDRAATFQAANVRDADEVAALVDGVVQAHGRLDILVNNAGGSPPVDAATVSPRFSAAVIDLNLTAALHCAQAANRIMQAQDTGGVIVNIASVAGTRPAPGTAAYGAAKAGLLNLTCSLAMEWAPKVRVNAVTPGLIRTEQTELHYGDDGLRRVEATVPLGRLGLPADVAAACVFLASDDAAYVTGTHLVVDGGGERSPLLSAADESEESRD